MYAQVENIVHRSCQPQERRLDQLNKFTLLPMIHCKRVSNLLWVYPGELPALIRPILMEKKDERKEIRRE